MIAISSFRGCITVARVPDLSIIAEIKPANYTHWSFPYPDLNEQIVPRRIRWSPNGSKLAYGWWDGTADIFDVKTQRLVTSLDQTDFGTPSVGFPFSCEGDLDWSPDGARILRTGVKKTLEKLPDGDFLVKTGGSEVLVFNVSSGRGLFRLGRGSEQAGSSTCTPNPGVLNAFSPDGSMIACWSGSLDLYDATSGRVITSTKMDGYVKSLAWSPNGELIALGTLKGRILVWRKSDRQVVSNISGHTSSVVSLSWKGSLLASASADWTVKLWYVHADGSITPIRTFTGWSSAPVGTISWYPDGERIAITSGPVETEIVSTFPGGGRAVTHKSRHSISVLTTDGSEQLRVEPAPEDGWAGLGYVSPDGRMIASITGRGEVSVWDAGFGSLASRLYTGQQAVVDLGWNPVRPGVLAVGGLDGIEIWNVFDVEPRPLSVVRLGGQVRCLAWSPDGTRLAVGYDLGSGGMSGSRIEIWDPYTPVMVCSQSAGGWWQVCSLAWSRDGSRLASLATLSWYNLTSNPLPREYCGLNQIGNVSVWRAGMKPAPSGLTVLSSVLVPRLSESYGISVQSWLDWAPNSTMLAVATGTSEFMGATRQDLESCPFLAEPAVRVYSLGSDGSGPLVPCLTLAYHVRPLSCVVWSPDGSRIAAVKG